MNKTEEAKSAVRVTHSWLSPLVDLMSITVTDHVNDAVASADGVIFMGPARFKKSKPVDLAEDIIHVALHILMDHQAEAAEVKLPMDHDLCRSVLAILFCSQVDRIMESWSGRKKDRGLTAAILPTTATIFDVLRQEDFDTSFNPLKFGEGGCGEVVGLSLPTSLAGLSQPATSAIIAAKVAAAGKLQGRADRYHPLLLKKMEEK